MSYLSAWNLGGACSSAKVTTCVMLGILASELQV